MRLVSLFVCLSAVASAEPAFPLQAGVGRVEITPGASMQMYGYANRKCGPSNGTHDPLFAKALVLEAGGSRMAIVTLDLGSMVSAKLKDEVASKLNIPLVLLSASHTHSAPAFLPYGSAPVLDDSGAAFLAATRYIIATAVQFRRTEAPESTIKSFVRKLRAVLSLLLPLNVGWSPPVYTSAILC